jgi:malonyl-CoA O-methyltransferase
MLQTIKIRRGFNRSARQYDLHSSLHRQIAEELFIQVTKEPRPRALLDVGCGTGYLTSRLKDRFPQSKIIGLDFAEDMLKVAGSKRGDITWVLADSHNLPFGDDCFDILTSNLAYQWPDDLCRVFSEARRVLTPGGLLACTLFGYHTCQELFRSLDEAKVALRFTRLPGISQVRHALTASGFQNLQIDSELIEVEFNGMQALIAWLKSIGANNLGQGFLGPEVLSHAASIYRKRFSYLQGVAATFEVIRVYAKR